MNQPVLYAIWLGRLNAMTSEKRLILVFLEEYIFRIDPHPQMEVLKSLGNL